MAGCGHETQYLFHLIATGVIAGLNMHECVVGFDGDVFGVEVAACPMGLLEAALQIGVFWTCDTVHVLGAGLEHSVESTEAVVGILRRDRMVS